MLLILLLHYAFSEKLEVVLISSNSEIKDSWRKSSRRHDCWLTLELGLGNPRLLPHPLHPRPQNVHPAHPCHGFQGHSLEREQYVVEAIWMVYVAEPREGRYIQTFKILADRCEDLLILGLPKTSLACQFFLLNLPPAYLEGPASFFGLSGLSVHRGHFQISPG